MKSFYTFCQTCGCICTWLCLCPWRRMRRLSRHEQNMQKRTDANMCVKSHTTRTTGRDEAVSNWGTVSLLDWMETEGGGGWGHIKVLTIAYVTLVRPRVSGLDRFWWWSPWRPRMTAVKVQMFVDPFTDREEEVHQWKTRDGRTRRPRVKVSQSTCSLRLHRRNPRSPCVGVDGCWTSLSLHHRSGRFGQRGPWSGSSWTGPVAEPPGVQVLPPVSLVLTLSCYGNKRLYSDGLAVINTDA